MAEICDDDGDELRKILTNKVKETKDWNDFSGVGRCDFGLNLGQVTASHGIRREEGGGSST